MIYLFMNIFCSGFHWNTSVFTSVKLCSYVSLMTTQTTNSHSNMPVFSPNTLITPLELGPAVVCWFSLLVKWTLLVIYEYCGFKNDFRKEKVATLLGIFTFNLRNIGLISSVDLLSKCCCVKLFFHFNVKLLLHTLQTDPVAGPLTRQCGPASGSGVQAIQSDWFSEVIGEQILFSLMHWGTSCYN